MLSRNLEQTLHRALAFANQRRHEYATLEHLLLALTEDQREVVLLKVDGELTFEQIGLMLGISANTVASRYRYALGRLRTLLLESPPASERRKGVSDGRD